MICFVFFIHFFFILFAANTKNRIQHVIKIVEIKKQKKKTWTNRETWLLVEHILQSTSEHSKKKDDTTPNCLPTANLKQVASITIKE